MGTVTRLRAAVATSGVSLAALAVLLTAVAAGPEALATPVARPGVPAGNQPPPDGARPTGRPGPTESPSPTESPGPTKPPKPPPDTVAPPPPDLGEPEVEPGGEITLAFAAEDRSLVEVVETGEDAESDQPVAQRRANAQAQELRWTAESGERTYAVTATDREGNESEPATVTIEVDADPPVVRRFEVTSGDARDPRSRVLLVTEPGTTYDVTVDGESVASGTTADTGREVIERTLDLADGRYPVEVDLSDETGNTTEDREVLVVAVGDLFVRARLTSEPTDLSQVVDIRATPGATGAVEVAGQPPESFEVAEDGTATVRLSLADGEYDGAVVTVSDETGREGSTELTGFAVDTTLPELELALVDGIAEEGRLAFEVTAEEGSEVDWRVLDTAGRVVTLGTFIASVTPEVIDRDVDEGTYTVEVSTSDIFDRTAEQQTEVAVASDPLTPRTLALAGLVLLVLLLALFLVARRLWRRRQDRREERRALGPRLSAQEDRAAYERAEEAWVSQHQALTRLVHVAHGDVPDDLHLPVGFTLLPGEVALWSASARLVDMVESGGADAALEGGSGEVVVTDQRLAFVGGGGAASRDWWLVAVERVRHLDHERTVLRVRDVEGWAGVAYDAQVTRQYLDLALARAQGAAYDGIVDQGLRDHEMRRPTPPA